MITIIKNSMHAYNYEITIFRLIYCFFSNDFLIFTRFQTIEGDSESKVFLLLFQIYDDNFTKDYQKVMFL